MLKRILFFAYGTFSYLIFFGTFLYAIGFIGNFGVPRTLDGAATGPLASSRCQPPVGPSQLQLTSAHVPSQHGARSTPTSARSAAGDTTTQCTLVGCARMPPR